MAGWAGFHPRMWKKTSKVQSRVDPAPKSQTTQTETCTASELTQVFKKQRSWLLNTLFSLFLSLNAGISKDAGTDRLIACLEQCKKQPACLSLSGTRAKPTAFLPPKSPANTSDQVSYFVGPDTMDTAVRKRFLHIYFVLTVFDDTKKYKFNFAFFPA